MKGVRFGFAGWSAAGGCWWHEAESNSLTKPNTSSLAMPSVPYPGGSPGGFLAGASVSGFVIL